MAQPSRYQRTKDFTTDFASEVDLGAINSELDGAAVSINGIRANLALIQRDDGGLVQGIVTADSVDPDFADQLSGNVQSGVAEALAQAEASAVAATLAATAAGTAQGAAGNSANSSATSASAAASSASSAATSAGTATTKANDAGTAAAAAIVNAGYSGASATASASSATAAAASVTAAAGSATAAAASNTAAGTQASNAATSATSAAAQVPLAAAQVTLAAAQVPLAAAQVTLANAAAAAAALSYDSFDDRFLGAKASNPALDNDGAALLVSAMYWNTAVNEMRVYSGTAWITVTNGIPTDGAVTQAKLAPGVAGTGPTFSAYSTTPQSVTSGIAARITLGIEEYDTDNAFTSSRFTPQVSGIYIVSGTVSAIGTNMTSNGAYFYKNGALSNAGQNAYYAGTSASVRESFSYSVYLNGTTDYLELWASCVGTSPMVTGALSGYLARSL